MKIDVQYDQDVKTLPAGMVDAVNREVALYEKTFTNNVEFTMHVGYGEVDGNAIAKGDNAQNIVGFDQVKYADVVNAYHANESGLVQDTAGQNLFSLKLPTFHGGPLAPVHMVDIGDPTHGGALQMTRVQEAALGMHTSGPLDAYVGISKNTTWDFNPSDGINKGANDFQSAVGHEISEIMGRHMDAGSDNHYSMMDLFHYSGAGVHQVNGIGGYFSYDGGHTNLGNLSTTAGADPGEWKDDGKGDSYGFAVSGQVNPLSSADLTEMEALGWHRPQPALGHIPINDPFHNPISIILGNNHPVPPDPNPGPLHVPGVVTDASHLPVLSHASFSTVLTANHTLQVLDPSHAVAHDATQPLTPFDTHSTLSTLHLNAAPLDLLHLH